MLYILHVVLHVVYIAGMFLCRSKEFELAELHNKSTVSYIITIQYMYIILVCVLDSTQLHISPWNVRQISPTHFGWHASYKGWESAWRDFARNRMTF